jgi:hypothetical protein
LEVVEKMVSMTARVEVEGVAMVRVEVEEVVLVVFLLPRQI